ncbi:hypothetical protein, unlikely [Trypanosoma brucei brucei TREU927]|uniref:Uncharacterized protein n=2 Tax=Trypanosoma brucei TaxID=5691 RepID=Q38EW3_TRYB2|nr:hypothetical protein, unlikely [Trypanosoma brucei brucei TREU927]EAN76657.1 hypothetical protein, unlikely [Trypanosoma brucei brucei TREU927]
MESSRKAQVEGLPVAVRHCGGRQKNTDPNFPFFRFAMGYFFTLTTQKGEEKPQLFRQSSLVEDVGTHSQISTQQKFTLANSTETA